jgi:hypothetical protein
MMMIRNISMSLQKVFVADAYLAEGQILYDEPAAKTEKSLKFRIGTGTPIIIIIIIIIIIKYKNSENVEHEMLCHTSNHWGHRNCKQKFTKISGKNTRTTLNRFPTKNCHTRNITHHKESATSLSGGVHHWLKRRSTREEGKSVTRNDDDDDNNNQNHVNITHHKESATS